MDFQFKAITHQDRSKPAKVGKAATKLSAMVAADSDLLNLTSFTLPASTSFFKAVFLGTVCLRLGR